MVGFELQADKGEAYFTASRLVPYKKVLLIIEAFNRMPEKRLVVMGDGPELDKARALAGPNVDIIGHQPRDVLMAHLQRSKAFVFAAEEDFGIAPLEAQACGTPVIAFGKGGARETIRGLDAQVPTGVFFHEQTPQAIVDAVVLFEAECSRITPEACRQNALRFSQERFRHEFTSWVQERLDQFDQQRALGTAARDCVR
jgi:glycosyltransferase involved in cell wall biosynthesis